MSKLSVDGAGMTATGYFHSFCGNDPEGFVLPALIQHIRDAVQDAGGTRFVGEEVVSGPRPPQELLGVPLNEVGRPERHPPFLREVEEGQARRRRPVQGSDSRRGVKHVSHVRSRLRLERPGRLFSCPENSSKIFYTADSPTAPSSSTRCLINKCYRRGGSGR